MNESSIFLIERQKLLNAFSLSGAMLFRPGQCAPERKVSVDAALG
jgi:hypothetical protein